jgi:hypothetical protein
MRALKQFYVRKMFVHLQLKANQGDSMVSAHAVSDAASLRGRLGRVQYYVVSGKFGVASWTPWPAICCQGNTVECTVRAFRCKISSPRTDFPAGTQTHVVRHCSLFADLPFRRVMQVLGPWHSEKEEESPIASGTRTTAARHCAARTEVGRS